MSDTDFNTQRLPVIRTAEELNIHWDTMRTIIGGRSVIDAMRVHVKDKTQAKAFLRAYGFDPDDPSDFNASLNVRDFALVYLNRDLLPYRGIREIPNHYLSMSIEELLVEASSPDEKKWPNWPCIQLKLLHCAAHALLTHDVEAHEAARLVIKKRFQGFLTGTENDLWFGDEDCRIPLIAFEVKEEKSFTRTMTKLLHKSGNLALNLYDRLGVRFVTSDPFSALLLIKFLRSRNLTMYANILPEHSRNSLARYEEFKELYDSDRPQFSPSEDSADNRQQLRPPNPHSHSSFRMIKFIERVLVKRSTGRRVFFPFEVQIIDQETWKSTQAGQANHKSYERRQINKVRRRLFGPRPKN